MVQPQSGPTARQSLGSLDSLNVLGGLGRSGPKSLLRSAVLAVLLASLLGLVPVRTAPVAAQRTFPNAKVVAPWGNDGNSGTADSPWQTLSHASRNVGPGDVVLIRAGTYTNQLTNVASRGEPGRRIVFRNYPGERPVIQGTGGFNSDGSKVWGGIHLVEPAAYLTFSGLEVAGTSDTVDTAGVMLWRTHHITVRNLNIHDFGGGGVNAASSEKLTIENNIIRNNAQWRPEAASGISIYQAIDFDGQTSGYTNIIRNNRVSHNENLVPHTSGEFTDGNCIVIDRFRDVGYTGRTLIANNVCSDNGGRGIHIFRSDNVHVLNNTLYHNRKTSQLTGDGELSTFEADNVLFRNNLVWPRDGLRAANPWLSTRIRFDNNLFVGSNGVRHGNGNIVVSDAKLRAPGTGSKADFRLRGDSPAIDAGHWVAPTTDRTRRARNGAPDIGAIEFRKRR